MRQPPIQPVDCRLVVPFDLDLVRSPLEISIVGDISSSDQNCIVRPLKLEQVVSFKYRIRNLCEDRIYECVSVLDNETRNYFISGEVKTKFDIMPLEEVELEFKVIPLYIGLQELPKLHILDR